MSRAHSLTHDGSVNTDVNMRSLVAQGYDRCKQADTDSNHAACPSISARSRTDKFYSLKASATSHNVVSIKPQFDGPSRHHGQVIQTTRTTLSSTTIERIKFRIPSALLRQVSYRYVSTRVGDHLGIRSVVVPFLDRTGSGAGQMEAEVGAEAMFEAGWVTPGRVKDMHHRCSPSMAQTRAHRMCYTTTMKSGKNAMSKRDMDMAKEQYSGVVNRSRDRSFSLTSRLSKGELATGSVGTRRSWESPQ